MGLFSRTKPGITSGQDALNAYQPTSQDDLYVGWVGNHQDALKQIAANIGWQPGNGDSTPLLATLKPGQDPKGKPANAVQIGPHRIGYIAPANTPQAIVHLFDGVGHTIAARINT